MMMTCEELLRALPRDPAVRLAELNQAQQLLELAMIGTVTELRERGYSWRRVGELIGLPLQTARRRWGPVTG